MYENDDQRSFARQLRREATSAEKNLWHFLRAEQLGVRFRRQAAIGPYLVDFVCFSHKLIVELDGPQHLEPIARAHDARRTTWLRQRGFRLIRFRNHELDEDVREVVTAIRRGLAESEKSDASPPSPTLPAEGREPERGGVKNRRRRAPE